MGGYAEASGYRYGTHRTLQRPHPKCSPQPLHDGHLDEVARNCARSRRKPATVEAMQALLPPNREHRSHHRKGWPPSGSAHHHMGLHDVGWVACRNLRPAKEQPGRETDSFTAPTVCRSVRFPGREIAVPAGVGAHRY